MSEQIPLVDYLVLGDSPHLVAHQCTNCGATYFDRRNACAGCFGTDFKQIDVATDGTVSTFTIVAMAAPGIPVPFVSAIVDIDGAHRRDADNAPERGSGRGHSHADTDFVQAPGERLEVVGADEDAARARRHGAVVRQMQRGMDVEHARQVDVGNERRHGAAAGGKHDLFGVDQDGRPTVPRRAADERTAAIERERLLGRGEDVAALLGAARHLVVAGHDALGYQYRLD